MQDTNAQRLLTKPGLGRFLDEARDICWTYLGDDAKKEGFRETMLKGRKETIDDFRLIAVKGNKI